MAKVLTVDQDRDELLITASAQEFAAAVPTLSRKKYTRLAHARYRASVGVEVDTLRPFTDEACTSVFHYLGGRG